MGSDWRPLWAELLGLLLMALAAGLFLGLPLALALTGGA